MTYPCINTSHFNADYGYPGHLQPEVMGNTQVKRIYANTLPSVSKTYTATAGTAGDVLIATDVTFNFDSPVPAFPVQLLIVCTLGSSMIEWRSRTDGSIKLETGVTIGAAPTAPNTTVRSWFGGGVNLGTSGTSVVYGMYTDRIPPVTVAHPFIQTITPGNKARLIARVFVTHDNWDTTAVVGGTSEWTNRVETGPLTIEAFTCPAPTAFP